MPARSLAASFVPGVTAVPGGPVAVVAASGGMNHALAFALAGRGSGIRLGVGLGNCVDVDAADVLEHLLGDKEVRAVALHVESVGDGRRLVDVISRLSERIPVAALVVGRSDVGDFARSHTGALATSWRTTRAALRQAGAVLVDDDRQLVDAVSALSLRRLLPTAQPGVGLVTGQAGPGLLIADALRSASVELPELRPETVATLATLLPPLTYQLNPVDTGRPDDGTLPKVLAAVGDDPRIDLVSLYALLEPDAFDLPVVIAAAAGPGRPPVVVTTAGAPVDVETALGALNRAGIPVAASAAATAAAVRALVDDARARHRRQDGAAPQALLPRLSGHLDEAQSKALLEQAGVPAQPHRACDDADAARAAFAELGGPVVVKLLDAEVLHKSEVVGVRLGVTTAADLEAALDALSAVGARRFLVERMAPPGPELLLGGRVDPVFGPVVVLGLGGTAAEALSDVTVRLAPLTRAEAASMLEDLAGRALVEGWRGAAAVTPGALADAVLAVGRLTAGTPGLAEVEVNPLRVLPDGGVVALDAVVRAEEITRA